MTVEKIKKAVENLLDDIEAYPFDEDWVKGYTYGKESAYRDCLELLSKYDSSEDIGDRIKRAKYISIPDKHGRIVDLDKVLDWLINEDDRFSIVTCAKIDNALKNAPVIMEASE